MSNGTLSTRLRLTAMCGWSPEMVGARARAWSLPKAWLTGTMACTIQAAPVAAGVIGWLDEPFPNLTTYLLQAIKALPIAVALLVTFWGIVIAVLAFSRKPLIANIICISPLATVVPGFIWSLFAFMSELADPANNVFPGATKPAWLTSWPIAILGSCLWFPVGLTLVVANGRAAYRLAKLMVSDEPVCKTCGYNLTGNISGTCPECGSPIPERPADAAGAVSPMEKNEQG